MYHYTDIPQWSQHKLSDNEVPLTELAASIDSCTGRFDLRQSKQISSTWTLWDVEKNNMAVITHAFVVRWTSPLDTGNFVPAGKPTPENLNEAGRKSEPGPNAQLSVAFDCNMDDSVHKSLAIIDKWAGMDSKFNPSRVPRSQWMTPSWIASSGKFIVNSQLFAVKSPLNTVAGKYNSPYEVHPWIAAVCDAKLSTWVPNPHRVQFYDAQEGVLESLDKCAEPNLLKGDLVKMAFRIVFTSGRTYWHCAIKPMQIVRVGRVASTYGSTAQEDEPVGLAMPKQGDKITLFKKRGIETEIGEQTSLVGSPDWDLEKEGDGGSDTEAKTGSSATASDDGVELGDLHDFSLANGDQADSDKNEQLDQNGINTDNKAARGGKITIVPKRKREDDNDTKKKVQKRKT